MCQPSPQDTTPPRSRRDSAAPERASGRDRPTRCARSPPTPARCNQYSLSPTAPATPQTASASTAPHTQTPSPSHAPASETRRACPARARERCAGRWPRCAAAACRVRVHWLEAAVAAARSEVSMRYRVVLHESEEGFAVACPGLPGCWSQGATEAEALDNIRSAIEEYLEAVATLTVGADVREVEVGVS